MPLPHARLPDAQRSIETGDGLALHVEQYLPAAAPRAALVLAHGFSSHCGLYRHVGAALADAGVAATLFDCRGHGRSGGRRAFVDRFSRFGDDLASVVERAQAASPALPLCLLGHSHGAVVVLDSVLSGRQRADALVLAAPWLALKLKVPWPKLVLSRVAGLLWPTLTLGNGLRPEDGSRDPDVRAVFDHDPLVHHVATGRWFNEVRAAQARILSRAEELRAPTLMMLAGEDRVVDTGASLAFAERANGAAPGTVEVRRYEGLFHEIFLEPEQDRILADLCSWIGARWPV